MARPRKTGLDYFPFDCDFFSDEKIVAIAGEFGIKGELCVVKLLCAIYRNGYFIVWSEMMRAKFLRELPGVSAELLTQIVARLVKWEFFDKNLFSTATVLTSVGIQRRYFNSVKRRMDKGELLYLLVDVNAENRVSAYINPTETEFLHTETPQSKVNIQQQKERSTDVDPKKKSSPLLDTEVETMKNSPIWVEEVMMKLNITDKSKIIELLDKFREHCVDDEKSGHINMADAKKHFLSWANINKKYDKQNDTDRTKNRRRGHVLTSAETKNYGTTF